MREYVIMFGRQTGKTLTIKKMFELEKFTMYMNSINYKHIARTVSNADIGNSNGSSWYTPFTNEYEEAYEDKKRFNIPGGRLINPSSMHSWPKGFKAGFESSEEGLGSREVRPWYSCVDGDKYAPVHVERDRHIYGWGVPDFK